jgi:hypothetical protein
MAGSFWQFPAAKLEGSPAVNICSGLYPQAVFICPDCSGMTGAGHSAGAVVRTRGPKCSITVSPCGLGAGCLLEMSNPSLRGTAYARGSCSGTSSLLMRDPQQVETWYPDWYASNWDCSLIAEWVIRLFARQYPRSVMGGTMMGLTSVFGFG